MPRILEQKLKKEYPNNPHAVFGTMNKIGAMKGNKETAKGKAIEKKMSETFKSNPFAKKYKETNEAREHGREATRKDKSNSLLKRK